MAVERQEIETYFGKCKCCLNYGYLRTMWEEHVEDNKTEVYGQMLTQCFSISWTIQGREDDDQICEDCVWKLREAYTFKEKVLQNQKQLHDEEVLVEEIKQEPDDDFVVEYLDEDILEKKNADYEDSDDESQDFEDKESQDEDDISFKDEDDISFKDDEDDKDYDENQNPQDDDDDFIPDKPVLRKRKAPKKADDSSDEENPKPKWPKKLPVEDRSKTYKQYTEENLKSAVDAVIAKTMNQRTAAKKFRIPRKTLSAKVLAVRSEEEPERPLTPTKDQAAVAENMAVLKQHRENIHSVLAYSNATPIRGHWGIGYACTFCPQQYKEPSSLKAHTRKHGHIADKLKVKHVRTHIVKLDITGLKCTICNTKIEVLETLMRHLKTRHGKPMNFAIKNHIVPYNFVNDELKCVKCGEQFNNFKNICEHMNNVHFRNYECEHCPRGFVNKSHLISHSSTHKTGEYPCSYCSKIFKTRLRRTEHERIKHLWNNKTRKCGYCVEKFVDVSQKIKHEVTMHGVEQPMFECNTCDSSFLSKQSLQCHVQKVHLLIRRYKCPEEGCEKKFFVNTELQAHIITHGDDKPFSCKLCSKEYKSKKALSVHMFAHNEKREFKCKMCRKRFMWKENLEAHLEKIHGLVYHKEVYSSTNTHSRKFIAEVKTLLSHTNVTPFRSRANNHYCFYCKGRTTFSNPKELRDHTQAQHDRTSRLEFVMRPLWKYESIKLDVKDPVCTICDISLKKWSDILEHLKTAHGIKFEYQDRMIPYVLDTNRACVFCGKKFSAFMLLDAHLNTHLRNYVCGHCGEPFVSSQRLKAHEKIHGNGRYPCYGCDKVFKRELYMKKHAIVAHSNELKVKCHHCSEMFKSEHHRQGHIVKHHREHVETISCEQCGMVFDWMRNFMRHMKKAHGTEHLCNQCGKFFESEKLLKKHEVKHTGVKEFKCLVCFKKYYSLSSMKCHLKYAHKNVIVVPLMSK